MKKFTIYILAAFFLTACAGVLPKKKLVAPANDDLIKSGSPYRWESREVEEGFVLKKVLIGIPTNSTNTLADRSLQKDIIGGIKQLEVKNGYSDFPTPVEIRMISHTPEETYEVWVFQRESSKYAYTVKLRTSSTGGVDIDLKGPWE